MNLFYSASLNGFILDPEIYNNLPDDLVEISASVRDEFVAGKEGFTMGPDKKGMPSWIAIPPPSKDQMIASAESVRKELKSVADSEISWRQDSVDAGISTEGEELDLKKWKLYRVSLMRVDTSKVPDISWPSKP
ncbi:tail fiber assembly protein [Pantoea allii]|uniref:tail fiber assembly protein n=1 Tax=Pantoea allii TaxID=574096 RepID=UPI003D7A0DA3